MFRAVAVLVALASAGVMADAASARTFQGSISPPAVSADGRMVSASVSATATCSASEYCGFFPLVTTVPADTACAPTITGSSWVGSSTTQFPATATWSEYPTLYAGGKRACLYAQINDAPKDVFVAEAMYQVPAPVPPPTYVPPSTYVPPPAQVGPPPVQFFLDYGEAIAVVRDAAFQLSHFVEDVYRAS